MNRLDAAIPLQKEAMVRNQEASSEVINQTMFPWMERFVFMFRTVASTINCQG